MFSWIVALLLSLNLMATPISPDKSDAVEGPNINQTEQPTQKNIIVEDAVIS